MQHGAMTQRRKRISRPLRHRCSHTENIADGRCCNKLSTAHDIRPLQTKNAHKPRCMPTRERSVQGTDARMHGDGTRRGRRNCQPATAATIAVLALACLVSLAGC